MRVSGWLYLTQQTACCLCLLWTLGRAAGLRRGRPWRMLTAALLNGLCCLLAAWADTPWLRVLTPLPLLLLTPRAVWPGLPRRVRLHMALSAGALGLTLAGWMRLTLTFGAGRTLLVPLSCGLLCALTPLLQRAAPPACVTVEIRRDSRRLTLTALIDSGNLLRDMVTGLPVIVISRRAAARLTPLPQPGKLLPGMRLMSVRTVGGTTLMAIFRPSAVYVEQRGTWRAVNAVIGLCPDGYEGFQALVPSSLVRDGDVRADSAAWPAAQADDPL